MLYSEYGKQTTFTRNYIGNDLRSVARETSGRFDTITMLTDSYAQAQAAEVAKQKAKNEQETAKVEAETKRIKAQGEADANKVLNDSLTDNVLRQHYIDALKNVDQLIVTPESSNTLIQPK